LTAELGPGGIANGTAEPDVTDKPSDVQVLDRQLAVGLGELGRGLMEEAATLVHDPGVIARKAPCRPGSIAGPWCGSREGSRGTPQPSQSPYQRLGSVEAADFDAVCGRGDREHGEAPIDAHPVNLQAVGAAGMASFSV
jgi:hypothetical protein